MSRHITAYFGKNTYALLSECLKCHRRYDRVGDWTVLFSNHLDDDDSAIVWYLICEECSNELEEDR